MGGEGLIFNWGRGGRKEEEGEEGREEEEGGGGYIPVTVPYVLPEKEATCLLGEGEEATYPGRRGGRQEDAGLPGGLEEGPLL